MQGLSLISRAKLRCTEPQMKEWDKVGQHGTIWNTLSHSVGKIRPVPTTYLGQTGISAASASTRVRQVFDCSSTTGRTTAEAQPKNCRSSLEAVSKTSRTAPEGVSNNSRTTVEALKPPPSFTFFDHLVEICQIIAGAATNFPRGQFPFVHKPVIGRAANTQDFPYLLDIQKFVILKTWFLFFQRPPGMIILFFCCFF